MVTARNLCWTALWAAILPCTAAAQIEASANPRAAISAVLERGRASSAASVLIQESGARGQAELNRFAEELVTIAASYQPGGSTAELRAANAASQAIGLAGSLLFVNERNAKLRRQGRTEGVLFTGAYQYLANIYEKSNSPEIQIGTLYLMTTLADTGRGVAFLANVAQRATPRAVTAVRHLSMDSGTAGIAQLRRLYTSNAVVEPTARTHLEAFAAAQGWTR